MSGVECREVVDVGVEDVHRWRRRRMESEVQDMDENGEGQFLDIVCMYVCVKHSTLLSKPSLPQSIPPHTHSLNNLFITSLQSKMFFTCTCVLACIEIN